MITNASCRKCAFFDDHTQASSAQDGLCRYNPPVSQPSATEHGLWPVVSTHDWCGHFSSNPTARQSAAE